MYPEDLHTLVTVTPYFTILPGLFTQNRNCPLLALGLFCRIHRYQLDACYCDGGMEDKCYQIVGHFWEYML